MEKSEIKKLVAYYTPKIMQGFAEVLEDNLKNIRKEKLITSVDIENEIGNSILFSVAFNISVTILNTLGRTTHFPIKDLVDRFCTDVRNQININSENKFKRPH